jgi:hypothetical protein
VFAKQKRKKSPAIQ